MRCQACEAELPAEARFCLSCGARVEPKAPDAPADPLREALDKAIGFQYRIERLLGRGGMGAVYLAHELALDRDVAIKVLPPEHAGTAALRERFKREARTAAKLNHPNIVPLHTFGEVSGLIYFVMGYVPGESLADRLERGGRFDPEPARTFLASLCDALDYAHRQGIVHRDIKPDNILVDAEGAPHLTDFGIAKATVTDGTLTTAGQLIGTPYYMSPEQAMGSADVGPQSDLYSLGVVAFEMVSGQLPFRAATPMDALTQRLTSPPTPLRSVASHVDPDLAQVINRCLEKDAAARWTSAKHVRDALLPPDEEVEDTQPLRILRTVATVVLPIAILLAGHLAVVSALRPGSREVRRITIMLTGMFSGASIVGLAMTVQLLRQGFGMRALAATILQQPRWWRSWYPRALRRPGDVWDRLPREFRQSRVFRGAMLIYVFGIFMPLQVILSWDNQLPDLRLAMTVATLTGVALLFVMRRRAVAAIAARTHTTPAGSITILNTPSWRLSTWRKAPAAALLSRPEGASRGGDATPLAAAGDAATRLATRISAADDRSTRLS